VVRGALARMALLQHVAEAAINEGAHLRRADAFGDRRRADDVGEEDGDELSLALERGAAGSYPGREVRRSVRRRGGGGGGWRHADARAATVTEGRVVRQLRGARWAAARRPRAPAPAGSRGRAGPPPPTRPPPPPPPPP